MTSWDVLQQILVTVGIGLACEEKGGEVARGRGLRLFYRELDGERIVIDGPRRGWPSSGTLIIHLPDRIFYYVYRYATCMHACTLPFNLGLRPPKQLNVAKWNKRKDAR